MSKLQAAVAADPAEVQSATLLPPAARTVGYRPHCRWPWHNKCRSIPMTLVRCWVGVNFTRVVYPLYHIHTVIEHCIKTLPGHDEPRRNEAGLGTNRPHLLSSQRSKPVDCRQTAELQSLDAQPRISRRHSRLERIFATPYLPR